jgi:anti-sigma B factor antagonist
VFTTQAASSWRPDQNGCKLSPRARYKTATEFVVWRHRTFRREEGQVSITIGKDGDTVVVGVQGQLIVGNRQELKQTVLDELDRGERRFRLDFSQTGYVDSSGLGVLVSLSRKIRERGGELRLANLNDDIKTLFKLTKLDALFGLGDGGEGGTAGAGVPAPVRPPPRAAGAEQQQPD